MTLLPKQQQNPVAEQAIQQLSSQFSKQILFMVGATDSDQAKQSAAQVAQVLSTSKLFESVTFRVPSDAFERWYQFYFPYRYQLLTASQRQLLTTKPTDYWVKQALYSFYGLDQVRLSNIKDDPFNLFSEWLTTQAQKSTISMDGDVLMVQDEQYHYALVTAKLKGNPFSFATQQQFQALSLPKVMMISSGMLYHASAATQQAKHEISTIGLGSLMAIIVLLITAFGSIRLIFVILLPILVGCLGAITVTLWVYEQIHIITLVIGASLIGVAIDYVLHYLCALKSPWRTIFPALLLSLCSTVLAYLAQALTPFPGLRQIALFAAVGLVFAWLTVVLWFPLLNLQAIRKTPWLVIFFAKITHYRLPIGLLLIFIILWALPSMQLNYADSVRLLQTPSEKLVANDKHVGQLLNMTKDSQFFLISADTEQQLLQLEETLMLALDTLIKQHDLLNYQSIAHSVPSLASQQAAYQLQKSALYDNSALPDLFQKLSATDALLAETQTQFNDNNSQILTIQTWLASEVSLPYRQLWLGFQQNKVNAMVILGGINGEQGIQQLSQIAKRYAGIEFIDKVGRISQLMTSYRQQISQWLLLAYFVVGCLFIWRYRWSAWRILLPPLLASMLSIAVLANLGYTFNLFNLLALVLILGIGLDCGIFLVETKYDINTWLAVSLSSLTTLFAFGLLSLSATPALQSFGLTVLLGISFVWLITSLLWKQTY